MFWLIPGIPVAVGAYFAWSAASTFLDGISPYQRAVVVLLAVIACGCWGSNRTTH